MEATAVGLEIVDTSVRARNGEPGLDWFGPALE